MRGRRGGDRQQVQPWRGPYRSTRDRPIGRGGACSSWAFERRREKSDVNQLTRCRSPWCDGARCTHHLRWACRGKQHQQHPTNAQGEPSDEAHARHGRPPGQCRSAAPSRGLRHGRLPVACRCVDSTGQPDLDRCVRHLQALPAPQGVFALSTRSHEEKHSERPPGFSRRPFCFLGPRSRPGSTRNTSTARQQHPTRPPTYRHRQPRGRLSERPVAQEGQATCWRR